MQCPCTVCTISSDVNATSRLLCCVGTFVCVRPGIQSEDQNQFFTFKVRTFWQSEVKISVLALWLCALSSLFHNMGVGGYGRNPLFVRARHVQRCVKKCPHFECVIHRFVLALNAWTNTLYTRVYIVSSLWMPGQVGGRCVCVYVCVCVWVHTHWAELELHLSFDRTSSKMCVDVTAKYKSYNCKSWPWPISYNEAVKNTWQIIALRKKFFGFKNLIHLTSLQRRMWHHCV